MCKTTGISWCFPRKLKLTTDSWDYEHSLLFYSLFSLRDINLTLGLLPPRRHMVWRDSVGVKSSGSGLKIRVHGYFSSELSLIVAPYTDEPQKGRNSCLWLQSCSVWSSFGVVLMMSCRVNFHVVQYDQHCSILLAEFNMSTLLFLQIRSL